ncbi:MAG: hypothetical protein KAZ87_07800 [Spirochaetes bacterium]|nr:hypothetical protein [Spirochaetota bacterium]
MLKKKLFFGLILLIVAPIIHCSSANIKTEKYNDKIVGFWERVGDTNAGLIVKVEQLSKQDSYIGKYVYVPPKLSKLISYGDVCWQNVLSIDQNQWRGNILRKSFNIFSNNVSVETLDAKYLLINDSVLEIYTNDQTQKWIRSKMNNEY